LNEDTVIRVITELGEFQALSAVWNNLLQSNGSENSIYLTHEWVSTWWKHFGEGKKLNILLIEREKQIIGIIPLIRNEYRVGLFKLHTLESMGAFNSNFVGLIPPQNGEEVITALLSYLVDELKKSNSIIMLKEVPEDSRFLGLLRRHAPVFSEYVFVEEKVTTLAPYILLPTTWDEYFRSLSRKRQQDLRRGLRDSQKTHGFEFRICADGELNNRLGEFFDLHQSRWRSDNINGMFSDPKMKEFYRDLATLLLKKNWLNFSYLAASGEMTSAVYGYMYNSKMYPSTAARDLRYAEYGVGHLHYMFLIKYAIEKGLREFDFLKGDEPYKFYWAKAARKYTRVMIIKRGICVDLRLRFVHEFLRFYWIRQQSLRELLSVYLMKRRDKRERKRMGLKVSV
jgi:CelD/BcsL family acetyltransferase involved in cellulose biosynthesis